MKDLNDTKIIGTEKRNKINEKVASHLEALDSLISKTDDAHNSLSRQNKELKRMC